MASRAQLGYYWGVLLPGVCEGLNLKKDHYPEACILIHEAYKEYFRVKTIGGASVHTTELIFSAIRMLMAREYGMLLPLPHDPPMKLLDIMPMSMFLKLTKDKYDKRQGTNKD